MPERPVDAVDVNPARLAADPLLAEIAALVGYMDLHMGRHEIRQLTTAQKELWADLVDADAVATANADPSMWPPRRSVRWWRDYARQVGEEGHVHGAQARCRGCGKVITWDADFEAFWVPFKAGNAPPGTFQCPGTARPHWALPDGAEEPDPFRYRDEGGDRVRGADQTTHVDEAAARVARGALLDVRDASHPHWLPRHDDFAAVYEWAKQAVRPTRMTVGDHAGEIGALYAYPSLDAARAFLASHRRRRDVPPDVPPDVPATA